MGRVDRFLIGTEAECVARCIFLTCVNSFPQIFRFTLGDERSESATVLVEFNKLAPCFWQNRFVLLSVG